MANEVVLHDSGGLETRGVRPDPGMRGAVARMIDEELRRRMRLAAPTLFHEMLWGVPCGPTLSMVHPPQMRGLAGLVQDYSQRRPR